MDTKTHATEHVDVETHEVQKTEGGGTVLVQPKEVINFEQSQHKQTRAQSFREEWRGIGWCMLPLVLDTPQTPLMLGTTPGTTFPCAPHNIWLIQYRSLHVLHMHDVGVRGISWNSSHRSGGFPCHVWPPIWRSRRICCFGKLAAWVHRCHPCW